MIKSTKTCELVIHLTTGECITGRFHVDAATSSSVRPSDAVRQEKTGYILLTDAKVTRGEETTDRPVVLVVPSSVAFIEIPMEKWTA